MGWIRTQLPGVVGLQGDNAELFHKAELPILGQNSSPLMTYYHQGASMGYRSALYLFPETESVVVVLTNSQPLNDAADWISQLYVAALFGFENSADYVELARESRRRLLAKFDELASSIDKARESNPGGIPRPMHVYVGRYYNDNGNFFIEIRKHSQKEGYFELAFQGRSTQVYELRHLRDDVFEWALDYDESAKRARSANWDPLYFEIQIDVEDGTLTWAKFTGARPLGLRLYRQSCAPDIKKGTFQSVMHATTSPAEG